MSGYIVVLHRHVRAEDMELLVSEVSHRHTSRAPEHVSFSATLSHSFRHLKMLSTAHLSATALRYLKTHEHVHSVRFNTPLTLDSDVATTINARRNLGTSASAPYAWGLDRIDQTTLPLDTVAYTAPSRTYAGRDSSVYVIDTGIDTTHVEFQNQEGNLREVKNVYNYFGDLSDNTDDNGHGTHCAGICGSCTCILTAILDCGVSCVIFRSYILFHMCIHVCIYPISLSSCSLFHSYNVM